LQGESRNAGNTVFLDWEKNSGPIADQWEYLAKVEKVASEKLDELYNRFSKENDKLKTSPKKKLELILKGQIFINKSNLPKVVVNFLKDSLNFANLEFTIKKRMGWE
jgi:hypothetical protein